MNRKQKKQIVKVVKEVLKKEIPKIKKQLMREMNQQGGVPQRQPQQQPQRRPQQRQAQQPQQQPQRPGQAQPAGQQSDGISQFKQIQEQMFEQGMNPAGEGGPTANPAPSGGQMSEKEMKQYAENLDPNGASANVQPDPTGGTIQQGQNESRQQFMKRLQQATGGKDPKQVFEESEKSSGGGNWRPGQDSS